MLGILSQNPLSIRPSGAYLYFLPRQAPKFSTFKLFCRHLDLSTGTTSKSSAFITLLRDYGFSSDQVESILLHKQYNFLSRLTETTLKPKVDYLLNFGFSQSELIKLIGINAGILSSGLETRLIPNLNLLKTLLGSVERIKKAIFHCSNLLRYDLDKTLTPNVETLRANGVPSKWIVFAVVYFPRAMVGNLDQFASVVKQIKTLGFDPFSMNFVVAVEAKMNISHSAWNRRVAIYKSFGWSDEDFDSAFLKKPHCMLTSEQKIKKMMEFYVNKLGWDPIFLAEQPFYVGLSLEKRVIPRSVVLNVLAERGLLGGGMELHRILVLRERHFEAKYVKTFVDQVPEIVEVYQSGVGEDFRALRSWQERNKQTAILPRKPELLQSSHKTCSEENGKV